MHRPLATTALAGSPVATPAAALLALVHTPEVNLDRAGEMPSKLLFRHPMAHGHVMAMGPPEPVFVRFRGERSDLTDALSPVVVTGLQNAGHAVEGMAGLARSGDDTVVVVPEPYRQASADTDVQQLTENVVNRGALPTARTEPAGLATEIVPSNEPYGVIAGSTFAGVVLAAGEPVAGAEVGIESPPAEPDVAANAPARDARAPVPDGAIPAITRADDAHVGKASSRDAVLRVYTHDMN